MLRTEKDLFNLSPPFLLLLPGRRWRLVAEVFPHPEGLCVLPPFYDRDARPLVLSGTPWHVADEVWELDYGVQIVRLREGDYAGHPAWAQWQEWLEHHAAHPPAPGLARRLAQGQGAGLQARQQANSNG